MLVKDREGHLDADGPQYVRDGTSYPYVALVVQGVFAFLRESKIVSAIAFF